MKHRIQTKRPEYSHRFDIHNGSAKRPFTWWEIHPDYQTLQTIQNLQNGDIIAYPKLDVLLRIAGSHSTLWLGNWQGIIAPMDIQPQGWSYPNGNPIEPEWWWQWHPTADTAAAIVKQLNSEVLSESQSSPLKSGVPFQFQRKNGDTLAVEAIQIQQLPNILKQDAPWIFEFDR